MSDPGPKPPSRGPSVRLSQQINGLAVITSLVAGGILILLVALTARGLATRSADQVLEEVSSEAVATVSQGAHGEPEVAGESVEPGVVVYDRAGRVVAGTPVFGLTTRYAELASVTEVRFSQVGDSFRLRAAPFTSPDGARGVVVAAVSLRGYGKAETFAIEVAAVAATALVLLVTAAAFWVSRQTWRRVSVMARTAESWSEHDLARRFDVGASGHELAVLASTLNGLLDKVARALGAEQRLTAELAHELRSPLAAAQGLTELLASRPDLDESMREDLSQLHAACAQMGSTITTLLDLARGGPGTKAVGTSVGDLLGAVTAGVPHSPQLLVPPPESVPERMLAGQQELLVRALKPVLENALREAARVRIGVEADDSSGWVLIHVDDDGPGIPVEVEETLFRPGVSTTRSAGLGLALARRVARSLGGDVELAPPPPAWSTRFTLRVRQVAEPR